jgi:hypothetical protein
MNEILLEMQEINNDNNKNFIVIAPYHREIFE